MVDNTGSDTEVKCLIGGQDDKLFIDNSNSVLKLDGKDINDVKKFDPILDEQYVHAMYVKYDI